MILAAYTKARKKTGTNYQILMEGDQLSVIKKGKMLDVTLNQSEGITESSYEETTDNMINKVAIYNSKNKKIGTVSNKNWISTYGTVSYTHLRLKKTMSYSILHLMQHVKQWRQQLESLMKTVQE